MPTDMTAINQALPAATPTPDAEALKAAGLGQKMASVGNALAGLSAIGGIIAGFKMKKKARKAKKKAERLAKANADASLTQTRLGLMDQALAQTGAIQGKLASVGRTGGAGVTGAGEAMGQISANLSAATGQAFAQNRSNLKATMQGIEDTYQQQRQQARSLIAKSAVGGVKALMNAVAPGSGMVLDAVPTDQLASM